ncbi:hypothetical protein [Methylobacterium sp. CM6247]
MNDNLLNIWQLRGGNSQSPLFKDLVDSAIGQAFPPVEGAFPERIAKALQAFEAAMGKRLASRPSSQVGAGGTARNAAHVNLDPLAPMADLTNVVFLPQNVRHGLRHPTEVGVWP